MTTEVSCRLLSLLGCLSSLTGPADHVVIVCAYVVCCWSIGVVLAFLVFVRFVDSDVGVVVFVMFQLCLRHRFRLVSSN